MGLLADALFTTTQQNVLRFLYGQPERSFYLKELLRLTGMGVHTIKRELDRMVEAGVLTLTPVGNQHHFQANPDCPIYGELLAVVRKTLGAADVIRQSLQPLEEQIELAFIYGSTADARDKATSDIDLMVVSATLGYSEIMTALQAAESQLGRRIELNIYNPGEFRKRLGSNQAFMQRVMHRPLIWLKGSLADVT